MGFVGNEFGPTLNKVGTIEHGFVTNFKKVGTIGYPNPTKRAPSMHHLIENSSKWALSEPNLDPNLTKWKLSRLKSGQVRIIGGGSCPRVELVRKVGILCGKGEDFQKKWSYCVGVVRVDVTTPAPYGHFFSKISTSPTQYGHFCEIGSIFDPLSQGKNGHIVWDGVLILEKK